MLMVEMVKNNVPGFCTEVEHAVKILELVKPDLSKNMKVLRRNIKNELGVGIVKN